MQKYTKYIAIKDENGELIPPKKIYFANESNSIFLIYVRTELDSSYYDIYDYCAIGQTTFPPTNFNPLVGDEFSYMSYNSRCGFGNSLMGFGAAKISNESLGFNLRVSGLSSVNIGAKTFGNVFCDYNYDGDVGEKGRIPLRCLESDKLWLHVIFDNGVGTINRANISHMQNLTSVNPTGYLYCLNGRQDWYYVNCDLGECELIGATSHYRFRPAKLKSNIYPHMSADKRIHRAGESGFIEEINNIFYASTNYRCYNVVNVTLVNLNDEGTTETLMCEEGFQYTIPSKDGYSVIVTDGTEMNTYIDGDVISITEDITLTFTYSNSVYGVEWDTENSSPNCTRIGNMSLHATLPVQSQMVGGVMTDDGIFTEFDNQEDWTQATQSRDGSDGQVMVKIPKFYVRYGVKGTYNRVLFSATPVNGFLESPLMYVSAYEAALDRTNLKLSSVVNTTAQYRGGNNNAAWDSEDTYGYNGESHRSLLGRPATSISITNFRTYARNRNNGDTQWNCYTYDIHKTLTWLFVVEYATLNVQKAFNAALTIDGYKQGGLGGGVTTYNGNLINTYNGPTAFIPCGYTDSFGNQTGIVSYTIKDENNINILTFDVPRYRGIENIYGHISKSTDGLYMQYNQNNLSIFYQNDVDLYSNLENYNNILNQNLVTGYIKSIHFNNTIFFIKENGGSSSTYYCSSFGFEVDSDNTDYMISIGGRCAYAAGTAGLFCTLSFKYNHTYTDKGSRLCYIPNPETNNE